MTRRQSGPCAAGGLAAAFLVMGCGSTEPGVTPTDGLERMGASPAYDSEAASVFAGRLRGVQQDPATTATIDGVVRIVSDGDSLSVDVRASGLAPDMAHPMFIHAGDRCIHADREPNGDGWLDPEEARVAIGNSLVALDDDLQDGDLQSFPETDSTGRLTYQASAPLGAIVEGLGPSAFRLQLAENVVQILGVDAAMDLPSTVQSYGDPPWSTLPAACAELESLARP